MNATPTLQELRAELDARAVYAKRIMAAMRAGDLAATELAQAEMRRAFPERRTS